VPFAIVFFPDNTQPTVLAAVDDQKLVGLLCRHARGQPPNRGGSTDLPDSNAARTWLATLPEPSGWFDSAAHACARLYQFRIDERPMSRKAQMTVREP
jgi:hypothetical protein